MGHGSFFFVRFGMLFDVSGRDVLLLLAPKKGVTGV